MVLSRDYSRKYRAPNGKAVWRISVKGFLDVLLVRLVNIELVFIYLLLRQHINSLSNPCTSN